MTFHVTGTDHFDSAEFIEPDLKFCTLFSRKSLSYEVDEPGGWTRDV